MELKKVVRYFWLIGIFITSCSTAFAIDSPANWPWRGIVITSASSANVNDIGYFAGININSVELQLDVRQVAQRLHLPPAEAWKKNLAWADQILDECKKYEITGVVSIFQIPIDPASGITQESPEFWDNPTRMKEAVDIVAKLADHFRSRGSELGAYSILSEPVVRRNGKPELPTAWTELLKTIVKTIRQRDRKHYILVSPCIGALPGAYVGVKPIDDPYIIYDAHMYVPHPYTHQGIYEYPLGVTYPGRVGGTYWGKKALEEYMSPLLEFQKKYNVPVFIGEFSAARWAPGSEQYLKDLIDIFDSHGWGWAYFQYKSYPAWDPDYDSQFSINQDFEKHYVGRNTARWKLLRDVYSKNKKRRAAFK